MKIALLGPYPAAPGRPVGGVQAAIESLVQGMSGLGHPVVVIDPFTGYRPTAGTDLCEVIRLTPMASWRAAMVRAPEYLTDAVGAAAPDILHVHLGAQYARMWEKSVLTIHGFPHFESRMRHPGLRGRVSASILRRSFMDGMASANRIISISSEVTRLAQEVGVTSMPIPNPVAQEFFEVTRTAGNHFVAVGDIMRRKNQKFLIDAFIDYVRGGGHGDLLLVGAVGDDEYYKECRTTASSVGDRVSFLGPRERKDVARLLAGAMASVSTSLRETSSIALAEALAAGCPVLSLDVGTAREQVTRPEHGTVLPLDCSVPDVSAAMTELATRSEVPGKLREAMLEQHPETIAAKTLAVYENVAP